MTYDMLLNLIKTNPNWQEYLQAEPRFIKIKPCPYTTETGELKYPELYMLSYNSLTSDYNDPIVRLCRGCIISIEDPTNPKMVCEPFVKFGNFIESYCPEIDWKSALVMDKVDGILIKLFNYKGEWTWITNNSWKIDTPVNNITKLISKYSEPETDDMTTVGQLIKYACDKVKFSFEVNDELREDYTYMFELLSPKCRILVDNKETELVYLGCRNNITQREEFKQEAYVHNPNLKKFKTVEYFDLHSMDETLALCNSYKDATKEGVVICDKNFNRIKIKCEYYILLKWYRNTLDTGKEEAILNGIKEKTIDDALQLFPEMTPRVNEIKKDLSDYIALLRSYYDEGRKKYLDFINSDPKTGRKNYAEWVLSQDENLKQAYFLSTKDEFLIDRHLEKVKYSQIRYFLDNYNRG